MIIRKEIRSISQDPVQLEKLRNAFHELQQREGPNGYQHIAGFHGIPGGLCKHPPDQRFLPWHRAYVLAMERALQEIDSDVHIPYWDWTSDVSIAEGIPEAYSVAQYERPNGTMARNPLHSAAKHTTGEMTDRDPRPSHLLQQYASEVGAAMSEPNFLQFSNIINGPHGSLHTWVRGSMGRADFAAYDPIFWAHHANVDRQWARWQRRHPDGDTTPDVQQMPLDPFGITVAEVLNHRASLNYDYDGLDGVQPFDLLHANDEGLFRMDSFRLPPRRVFLRVHGLTMSEESFNVDIFINQPDANSDTPIYDNPNFAGSFGIFGMGHPLIHHGGGGHHEGHHTHDAATPAKTFRDIDITEVVGRVAAEGEAIQVKLIAKTLTEQYIEIDRVSLEGVSIETG